MPGRMIGLDSVATEIGRAVALHEVNQLLNSVSADVAASATADAATDVRGAIADMRAMGLNPTVVMKPVGWQLERSLEIDRGGGDRPRPPDWWGIPEGAAHWYRGRIEGVPVFDHPQLKGQIFVLDLGELGTWTQGLDSNREALVVEVRTTTQQEAEATVHAAHTAEPLEGESFAAAVRAALLDARVKASERVTFVIACPEAAIRLTLPSASE